MVPTVFVTTLERPLILTNVRPHVTALLGDFGISDEALLALVSGKATPQGRLPVRTSILCRSGATTEERSAARFTIAAVSDWIRIALLRAGSADWI